MTVKEIAEAVGKNPTTVQRWIKRAGCKMQSVADKMQLSNPTYPADFDIDETVEIIEAGMGKNAADLYRMSAQDKAKKETQINDIDSAFKLAIINLSNMVGSHETRIKQIESKIETRQALLPAPQIKPRDNVTRIVRDYAHKIGIDYSAAWGELYKEFSYRTNSNPRQCAKNRGMAIVDYIESEGQIETLEAVAIDYMGGNA